VKWREGRHRKNIGARRWGGFKTEEEKSREPGLGLKSETEEGRGRRSTWPWGKPGQREKKNGLALKTGSQKPREPSGTQQNWKSGDRKARERDGACSVKKGGSTGKPTYLQVQAKCKKIGKSAAVQWAKHPRG